MAAVTYDILLEQGATYQKTFIWKDSDYVAVDLTGYTARMQMRKTKSATEVLVTATTENGYITITAEEGKIEIEIPAEITAAVTFLHGVWDIELIDSEGIVTRLLEGCVEVSREVTR